MRATFPSSYVLSLEGAYELEMETADHFLAIFEDQEWDMEPLQVRVDVADRLIPSDKVAVTAAVTLLYESDNTDGFPVLREILENAIGSAPAPTFSFGTPTIVFQPLDGSDVIIDTRGKDGRSSSEVGLIVAVSFLSILLAIVSSVLLHITGGWKVCGNGL